MDEKKENLQETEIDLRVVLDILRKNIIPILIETLLFAAMAFVYSSIFITKQYQASATLIVNNKAEGTTTYNTSEMNAAQSLADVYSIIIKSDTVLQPVIDELNLNMSYEKLKNSITVSTVNSTQVITRVRIPAGPLILLASMKFLGYIKNQTLYTIKNNTVHYTA